MKTNNLLKINNLNASFIKKNILNKLNLTINTGETHVIMGPNGAGKSTLANILTGNFKNYNISGEIRFNDINLLELSIEEISLAGIFMSFQHPVEIPGLSNTSFFKSFINAHRKNKNLDPIEPIEFTNILNKYSQELNIKHDLLSRSVNESFSGGEKKRNEILQLLLLNPKFIILDEIDSGLDVDSLKLVFQALNKFKNENNAIMIITHYAKILDYINVNHVHILANGEILKSGNKDLAYKIEKYGYNSIENFKL